MQRLTAQELKRRYRAGERNFGGVDLSGESLRGINLKGIDLSRADLSRTDIRGTNFTKATLIGTQFVSAKAGTQHHWIVPQLMIAFILATLSSFLIGVLWGSFGSSIVSPSGDTTGTATSDIVFGVLGIVITLGFLGLIYTRGVLAALTVSLGAFAFSFAAAFVFEEPLIFTFAGAGASVVAVAFAIAFAVAGIFAVAVAGVGAVAGAIAGVVAVIGASPTVIACAIISVLATIVANVLMARRTLSGDSRDTSIRNIAVWFSSWGSTKFIKSNLADASFHKTMLKSTHLYQTNLARTNFHLSKEVNLSRLGKTILANFQGRCCMNRVLRTGSWHKV